MPLRCLPTTLAVAAVILASTPALAGCAADSELGKAGMELACSTYRASDASTGLSVSAARTIAEVVSSVSTDEQLASIANEVSANTQSDELRAKLRDAIAPYCG